jgi:phospholipid/cholesterol/gamma-HCH transport system substrate-binding protein
MSKPRRTSRLGVRGVPFGRTTILVQALAALAFVVYLFASDNVHAPFLHQSYTLKASFDDASGLNGKDGREVTIAGVRVGKVTDVRYTHGRAVADLQLDDDAKGRVHSDARVAIVPRSALQDQIVEITPGSRGGVLEDGDRITASLTASPVQLDRVLETLDADSRAQLQILLGELRTGLRGRETPLRKALARLDDVVSSGSQVAGALADRRKLLTRLVDELDTVFTTLGRRDTTLREVITAGRRTLQTTAGRDAEVAATVRELPRTLDGLGSALADVRSLAQPLQPALEELRPAAKQLPATLRSLRDFVPSGQGLVKDLGGLVDDGRRPAVALRGALEQLGPTSEGLHEPVAGLQPIVAAIDKNKNGIGLLGERFSGVFSTNDANGIILRGLGFFEKPDPANLGVPGATGAQLRTLQRKSVQALLKACKDNPLACIARYLIPGLPGAVRTAEDPLGTAKAKSGGRP